MSRRNFGSDNVTPMAPEIMAALQRANEDAVASYGGDPLTAALERRAAALFEREVAVFPVATGTSGNALALSVLVPPYGTVFCHDDAHIATDECGAPEFYMGGAKVVGLRGAMGKLTPAAIETPLGHARMMGVHHTEPAAVSLTQATESGTVYGLEEVATLSAYAHAEGLSVHMDGARFANALVTLGCTPAEATWKAGVDVLVLGATKNGAMAAEAVVFFDPARARGFAHRRKRGGHLWSKQRFLSAQLLAYLEDGLWLRLAAQANRMAGRLATGIETLGGRLAQPVQSNEVFVSLPEAQVARMLAEGYVFYRWAADRTMAPRDGVETMIRLVTSYDMTEADIDGFLSALRGVA